MTEAAACYSNGYGPTRWWNNPTFPLVPVLNVRKSIKPAGNWDSGTCRGFTLSWLGLAIWTLENPSFELAIVADFHWGIGVTGIIPYLRWKVTIPPPAALQTWAYKNLNRRP